MIVIEDTNHCDWVAEFETLREAMAELMYLSSVPWDRPPNKCPCRSWQKCERAYTLVEFDDPQGNHKPLRRLLVLNVSRHGAKWVGDVEENWRLAAGA
jgi:hypothetical protein